MKDKEELLSKTLLDIEVFIGVIVSILLLVVILLAYYLPLDENIQVLIIICGIIFFMIGIFICLKIEQIAGYYECRECKHKHIPSYKSVFWAMHFGRTRYLKCPECGNKSWQKKVLTK